MGQKSLKTKTILAIVVLGACEIENSQVSGSPSPKSSSAGSHGPARTLDECQPAETRWPSPRSSRTGEKEVLSLTKKLLCGTWMGHDSVTLEQHGLVSFRHRLDTLLFTINGVEWSRVTIDSAYIESGSEVEGDRYSKPYAIRGRIRFLDNEKINGTTISSFSLMEGGVLLLAGEPSAQFEDAYNESLGLFRHVTSSDQLGRELQRSKDSLGAAIRVFPGLIRFMAVFSDGRAQPTRDAANRDTMVLAVTGKLARSKKEHGQSTSTPRAGIYAPSSRDLDTQMYMRCMRLFNNGNPVNSEEYLECRNEYNSRNGRRILP
jgi:hypothetical protein